MNVKSVFKSSYRRVSRVLSNYRRRNTPFVSAQGLSDEAFLALFRLEAVSTLLAQKDIEGAKKALLKHYQRRTKPGWPDIPDSLPDLRLSVWALNEEELITQANLILDHRFNLFGMPEVIFDDKIDWHYHPMPNPQWTRTLNRHSWWPLLAWAYGYTGDERYAAEFVSQMLHWVKNNSPPRSKNESSLTWRLMEVGMRMYLSWIPAFGMFYHSPSFTAEAKLVMLRSIYDHGQFLSLYRSKNNHLLAESNGLAYTAVYFPEFEAAGRWQQIGLTRLDTALGEQINQDGSHIEMSVGYQGYVIDKFQRTYNLLHANELSLPDRDLAAWLKKMYRVMAYVIRPDGTLPQINDGVVGDRESGLRVISRAGQLFDCQDLIFIGAGGRQGTPPPDTSVSFEDAGLYVMRSDWTGGARYLLFDAGPYGGFHGHEDKLSIELYAYGQPYIIDSGSYTYYPDDPFRLYFVGSQGHSTVLVDGHSQVRRWKKEHRRPKTASGNYATWVSQPDFDYVASSYEEGYAPFALKKPEAAPVIDDVTHTRRILFVKPDYWVMVDELRAAQPHTYQLLFQTAPDIRVELGAEHTAILSGKSGSGPLCLMPADPEKVKVNSITGSENPIQGWYSESFEQKTPATTIIYEYQAAASTVLITLIYPKPGSNLEDEVAIYPLAVSGGEGVACQVVTENGRDYFMFGLDNNLKQFGPHQSRARLAGIRTDTMDNILKQFEW